MWTSLRRFLGSSAGAPVVLQAVAPAAPPSVPETDEPTLLELDLDAHFSARLLNAELASPAAIGRAERALLAKLEELTQATAGNALVPRLPAALPRLLNLVRRDDVSNRELAEHLARDPALLGEVVRLANSPRYRGSGEIASLEAAVQLLGHAGLQQLVSRVLLGPVFNLRQGQFSRSASTLLWAHAERCAHACAFLRIGKTEHFDAYLAGMLANAGLIAALRVLDQDYRAPTLPGLPGFHAALFDVTARLSAHIASLWDFPPAVIEALRLRARRDGMPPVGSLARDLLSADQLSKLHLLGQPADAPPARLTAAENRCWLELQRSFGG